MNSPKGEDHNISNFETLQWLIIDLFIYLLMGQSEMPIPTKKRRLNLDDPQHLINMESHLP
jgi:hypothetical protein